MKNENVLDLALVIDENHLLRDVNAKGRKERRKGKITDESA